jgi:hypothetical protein
MASGVEQELGNTAAAASKMRVANVFIMIMV